MSASKRRDLLAQTLSEYLQTGDENRFHDIIESGREFIEELTAQFERERGRMQNSQSLSRQRTTLEGKRRFFGLSLSSPG